MTIGLLFLSKADDSASTRYRALQFFPRLEAAGFACRHLALAGSPAAYLRALRAARQAKIVIVLRKTLPTPVLFLLRKLSGKLVFDFDDAIFCNSDGSPSPTRLSRFKQMLQACDHVLAGNHFLAAAQTHNPAVTFLPTAVDLDRYEVAVAQPADWIDLVWIGSSSTRKYLETALPALQAAALRLPNLRLKIIADFDLPEAGIRTLAIRWSAENEVRELASAHIGIAPMLDNDWTKGKCALKVLQYFAAGLPVISSRAGVNAEVVRPGENGELVTNPDEWVNAIEALALNPELRQRYGNHGRQLVRQEYALDIVAQRLVTTLQQLSA